MNGAPGPGAGFSASSSEADVGTAGRLMSACAGSAAVALTCTPLDVAKVRMQAAGAAARDRAAAGARGLAATSSVFFCSNGIMEHCFDRRHCFGACAAPPAVPAAEIGLVRTLRNIAAEGGISGLYAGLPATLLIAVPNNMLYFATYEALRDRLQGAPALLAASAPGIAGGGARAVAAAAVAPLEVVRVRAQAGWVAGGAAAGASGGVGAMLAEIVREQGVRALFLGLSSTMWRDVPFSALYWLGVERIRDALLRRGWWEGSAAQAPLAAMVAGVISGGAAALVTTPFDVMKTRQQLDRTAHTTVRGTGKVHGAEGLWRSMARVAQEEGTSALLAGAVPRTARVAPACAIMLASYEVTKATWRRARELA